jgi:hypothetical protein
LQVFSRAFVHAQNLNAALSTASVATQALPAANCASAKEAHANTNEK